MQGHQKSIKLPFTRKRTLIHNGQKYIPQCCHVFLINLKHGPVTQLIQ